MNNEIVQTVKTDVSVYLSVIKNILKMIMDCDDIFQIIALLDKLADRFDEIWENEYAVKAVKIINAIEHSNEPNVDSYKDLIRFDFARYF